MQKVNMLEAKTHLSRLVQEAARGKEVIIARAGEPVAKLVPFRQDHAPRKPGGRWRGKVRMAPEFDTMPPEVLAAFTGEEDG